MSVLLNLLLNLDTLPAVGGSVARTNGGSFHTLTLTRTHSRTLSHTLSLTLNRMTTPHSVPLAGRLDAPRGARGPLRA